MYYFPLAASCQGGQTLAHIFSFSLFQRSIAEGKEGEEGGGEEGDYKVIYQVNQSWPPAAMADISIEAWKLI